MKRLILTVGKNSNNKYYFISRKAQEYRPDQVRRIEFNPRSKMDVFLFQECDINTKLLIVDFHGNDIDSLQHFYKFFPTDRNVMWIEKKGQNGFHIPCPEILINVDQSLLEFDLSKLDNSFKRRFEIYVFGNPEEIKDKTQILFYSIT